MLLSEDGGEASLRNVVFCDQKRDDGKMSNVQICVSLMANSRCQNFWHVNHTLWGQLRSYLEEIVVAPVKKTETNDRGDPLRWPRNALYPQKLVLLRQQAAVARSS
jgi:hypothetical protein